MKKKIIGSIVCTLLIVATVLPVAGTNENNESSSDMQPVPTWGYHFDPSNHYPDVAGGCLMVWGTENCKRICPALFMGYANRCTVYSGVIPDTISHPGDSTVDVVNDIIYDFVWDWHCNNHVSQKYAAPDYGPDGWELVPIREFILENYIEPAYYPNLALCEPEPITELHVAVRVDMALENPPTMQEEYYIENGTCEDLGPGYVIGTTPIIFNPQAGPDDNPFETTLFTGTVINVGELILSPEPIEECCPEIEIRQGIGIGVTAIIRNPCNETFTDLKWSMVIDGMVFLGGEKNGVISSLEPGEEVTIKSGLILGFGFTRLP